MYVGVVVVFFMIGDWLGFLKEVIVMFISLDFFCCGIVILL